MSATVKPLIDAGFHLKGLKKWNTRDGGGYQFTLIRHGKPVAEITNDGQGGETRVNWIGLRWDGSVLSGLSPADTKKAVLVQTAKADFNAIVKAAPQFESYGMTLSMNDDILLEELLSYVERLKLCKTKTVFRLPDDPTAEHVLKAPFNPEVRAYVLRKWPAAIILNENPFA